MKLSKKLGPALMVTAAVLSLSACNSEEAPLERKTTPGPISTFQGTPVTQEVGGFVLKDYLLVRLIEKVGGYATVGSSFACATSGSRADTASTVSGYDHHATFSACKVDGITFTGSAELREDGGLRRAQFNGLTVETRYNGGNLKLQFTGSLEVESSSSGDDEYDDLAIPHLVMEGGIAQYNRVSPIKLEIRDYSRAIHTNSGAANYQSLSVIGRLTKSGDYGTYDLAFSNIPVDGSDTLRKLYEGVYTANSYTTGKLYISDLLKTSSFLALAPSAEYETDAGETVEAGKYVHFTGKIDAISFDALLEWAGLSPPFLIGIFNTTP